MRNCNFKGYCSLKEKGKCTHQYTCSGKDKGIPITKLFFKTNKE